MSRSDDAPMVPTGESRKAVRSCHLPSMCARIFSAQCAILQDGEFTMNFENDNAAPDKPGPGLKRRRFLQGAAAASFIGAVGLKSGLAQSTAGAPIEGETREQLRRDMLAGVEDDIKKDLEMRGKAAEELPKPKNLREGGMLDARFPVYYRTSVPEAMRLLTEYFAAYNDRDMAAVID